MREVNGAVMTRLRYKELLRGDCEGGASAAIVLIFLLFWWGVRGPITIR